MKILCVVTLVVTLFVLIWTCVLVATIDSSACDVCDSRKEIKIEIESKEDFTVETDVPVKPLSTEEVIAEHVYTENLSKENDVPKMYTSEDAIMIAKLLYTECRGVKSQTQKACVAWTVLNRVDADEGTIARVITKPNQFAYNTNAPIVDDLYDLAVDVLDRWSAEKSGEADVGRVLPMEYRFFYGDGKRNYFKDAYKNGNIWDYSLDSPYES